MLFIFSAGYNAWRDTKKPTTILSELCHRANITPIYATDGRSLTIGDQHFECDPECIEFIDKRKSSLHEKSYRKVDHEAPEKYLKENTALAALHGWGKRINPVIINSYFYIFYMKCFFFFHSMGL